jgi:subtilisin family serine protease
VALQESTAVGAGVDCTAAAGSSNTKAQSDCSHGTHVASIAAGDNGSTIVGVAPDANIIAVQVFSLFTSTSSCGGFSSCMLSYTSDQIAALEHIYELRNTYNIASVNMSLGGGSYIDACDGDGRKAAIDNLRAAGIATVIASGNNGYRSSLSAPACISSAISVGATDDSDNVASFFQRGAYVGSAGARSEHLCGRSQRRGHQAGHLDGHAARDRCLGRIEASGAGRVGG